MYQATPEDLEGLEPYFAAQGIEVGKLTAYQRDHAAELYSKLVMAKVDGQGAVETLSLNDYLGAIAQGTTKAVVQR